MSSEVHRFIGLFGTHVEDLTLILPGLLQNVNMRHHLMNMFSNARKLHVEGWCYPEEGEREVTMIFATILDELEFLKDVTLASVSIDRCHWTIEGSMLYSAMDTVMWDFNKNGRHFRWKHWLTKPEESNYGDSDPEWSSDSDSDSEADSENDE